MTAATRKARQRKREARHLKRLDLGIYGEVWVPGPFLARVRALFKEMEDD